MASEAGRGAQVILDGDARKAARGVLSPSVEGNRDLKRALELAGTFADGTTLDGSTRSGTAAEDPVVDPGGVVAGGGGAVTPANVSDQANTSTGYFQVPTGTSAQEPAGAEGQIRRDTTLGRLRARGATLWHSLAYATGDVFSGGVRSTVRALTDAATVTPDMTGNATNSGNMFTLLATSGVGNTRQLAKPTGLTAGNAATIQILYTQDATGGRALTFATGITVKSGTITTTANAVSIVSMSTFDAGTTWYAVIV